MEAPVGSPLPTDLGPRAEYLSRYLGIDPHEYRATAAALLDGLKEAAGHDEDEVVLWFDPDLFCVANFCFVVDRLAREGFGGALSLICPESTPSPGGGVASLPPGRMVALHAGRSPLSPEALAWMSRAWDAYSAASPTGLAVMLDDDRGQALPFAAAWRAHLARFPSANRGLDQVETRALELLAAQGCAGFVQLFPAVAGHGTIPALGMGDVQFAGLLRQLAGGPAPLVKIEAPGSSIGNEGPGQWPDFRTWRIAISEVGREVLAGRNDRVVVNGIDRYLGGVYLHGHRGIWRRDARAGTLALG